jgi:nucleotide-binding universal stress UspA family protein
MSEKQLREETAMRILLATDGSDCADTARELVNAIDWPAGSVIRVVTVVEPLEVVFGAPWAGRLAGEVENLTADLQQHGEAILEATARGLMRGGHALERVVLHWPRGDRGCQRRPAAWTVAPAAVGGGLRADDARLLRGLP